MDPIIEGHGGKGGDPKAGGEHVAAAGLGLEPHKYDALEHDFQEVGDTLKPQRLSDLGSNSAGQAC